MNPDLLRVDGRAYRIGFLKDITSSQEKEICKIFNQVCGGSKIEAINRQDWFLNKARSLLGAGLAESKDLMDAFEQFGVNEVLAKFRSSPERFKRYRRIDFETKVEKVELIKCPICSQEPDDPVAVVTKTRERIGYFCRKCYDYLITLPDTLNQVKRDIDSAKFTSKNLKRLKKCLKITLDKNKRICYI